MPVHLFGLPVDMAPIMDVAERHQIAMIEDACQAHGARYRGRTVGSFGTGCFSFYPTKNMTTAEGGMITTDDDAVAERCRTLRQHGMRRRYYHDMLGFNFRMTDVQAAIGLPQLARLDDLNDRRRANATFLSRNLRGVSTPITPEGSTHAFHQYTVRVLDGRRDDLLEALTEQGIGAGVYYPVPVHQQRVYRDMDYNQRLPESERAAREVLSLPVHPSLTGDDLHAIVAAVNGWSA